MSLRSRSGQNCRGNRRHYGTPFRAELISSVIFNSMKHPVVQVRGNGEICKAKDLSGTTPVPNDLLDRVMPTLRDTELRVLLVVVRQTLGWMVGADPARRKDRDWLTQSQLRQRTGRASEAVSHAVDTLVQAGLINVTDRRGIPKKTTDERRRHLGHLYYQLGPGARAVDNGHGTVDNSSKSEDAKPNTTKETVIQKYRAKNKNVDNSTEPPFVVRSTHLSRVVEGKPVGNLYRQKCNENPLKN